MLRKTCEAPGLKFFGEDGGPGSMSGYLSTFNNWDRGKEMVLPGAFAKHLETTLRDGFLTINHNWDVLSIGTFTDLHEDDRGLFFSADFHSTPAAQDARTVAMERAARGKSVSTSIGYNVADSERTKDGLLLKDLPLYEGSLVNVPMNTLALVTGVKGASPLDDDADHDDVLTRVWSPPAGLTLADEFDAALAALSHAIDRKQAVMILRAKAGRVHSAAQIDAMSAMTDSLGAHVATLRGWCADAAPKSAPQPAADAARREHARYLLWQAQQLGVPLG